MIELDDQAETTDVGRRFTEPLTCINVGCYRSVIPRNDWRCPACESVMKFGYTRQPCDRCGEMVLWLRRGYEWTCKCNCTETEDQRANRIKHEADRLKREAAEQEKADAAKQLRKTRENQADWMKKAASCWHNEKRQSCKVSKSDLSEPPREFCRFCPKFAKE